ncbi:MAG: hypothetical protein FJ149_10375, partial [Euryarchaeota archaeon]|nr:hypothetical protein [Euryarchaeota archaeon]
MAGRRSIAALAVLLGVMQLAPLLPLAGARDISTFSDGSASADALLAAGGNATAANLSVPLSSVVLGCSLGVSTLAGAGWPLSPSLDIGGDGTVDWGFGGIGYGRFGSQDVFVDGASTKELRFIAPGNGTARLLLPKNATVEPASLDIEGFADQRWWNSSWRDRLPLTVRDLSGSNQTDFSVEVLLDTRNWTLASAEREFRVTSVNSTTLEETEVPLQVIDEIGNGSKCFEAGLVFAVRGLGANGSRTYHLYFNNPAASRSPDFSDFRPRLIKSRLADQPVQASFFGPLSGPAGACFDDGGNYWVADQGRMAVFGFTGTLGRPDAGGSDASRLRFPTDVAVRYDGKVIVSDRDNYRVQVFAPDGTLSFTLGATGSPGSDNSHFGLPGGVGTDGEGNIYVADTSVHRVQIFDRNGTWLDTIGAPGMPGSDNDHLYSPTGIWVSRTGNVLVADLGNQRVQAFARTGRASWSWNYTLGTTGVPGTDNDHFMSPMDVCQDGPGRTYVVDMANHRVQVFTGKVYKATLGVTGAPGPDSSHLTAPMGVAVSPSGRVFVSDTGAHRVQVFDSSYKYSQTLGNRSASCLGGPGTTDYAFDSPGGVAADASGRIYVSDTLNHRVQIFTALGGLAARLGQTGTPGYDPSHFMHPRGLEVGTDGRVFVADGGGHPPGTLASNHRVLVFFDLADGAADFQLGITGQPGNTSLNLNQPWDVSVNGAGRIAVADKGITLSGPMTFHQGTRVQLFNGLGDAAADYTLGVSGLPGMDSTRLSFPRGVGETEDGSVFVADTGNNRVVLFKNDGGASADLVLNPSGTAGSGQGQFRAPSDVDLDASGRIFVADTGNHRISVFDGSGVPLYILGETGVYGSDDRHLSGPEGLKVADDGKLYIADTGNHRVVRVSPASLDIGPVEGLAAPEDVSLDVGGDGSPEWERKGFLVGRSTVTGLGAAIDRALAGGTAQADAFGNGMVTVAVNLSNAGNGRITLSNLTIVYRCTLEASGLDRAIGDYVLLHAAEADAAGNVSVPVVCSASSAGGVTLGDLRLLVDMPPELLVPVPDRALDEDTSDPALYDLSEFFQDDLDAVLDYSLVNLTNATPNITLTPGGVLSVDCTAPPARDWNGVVEFSVRAADSRGLATVSNKVRLTVRPVNDPPDLTSSPPVIAARVGTEWSYDAAAHDPDGDRLTFTLETRPAGMTVDPASGRLSWTPSAADVGTHQVGLRVTDGFLSDRQNFSVNVAPAGATNRPPVISSTPVTAAGIGKRYVYQVVARDDDGDALAYSLETAPSGMTVGEANGTVEWVPLASQEGRHEVVVRVHDGNVAVTQGFNLTVTSGAVDLLPTVSITEPRAGASVGGKVWIRGTASARNATVERVEVSVDLDGRWVEAAGKTSWALRLDTAGLSNGRHTVFVRALDSAGNWGQ